MMDGKLAKTVKGSRAASGPVSSERPRKMSVTKRVHRLDELLNKSIAYSTFLESKMSADEDTKPPLSLTTPLREYQLTGMKWMVGLWENGLNGILGDEMGLGKTVQAISLLAYLSDHATTGPFLVVAPLSTLDNWKREVTTHFPSAALSVYHGTDRAKMLAHVDGIYLTTYEVVMRDVKVLQKLTWKFVVVDEGHRLKNLNCRLLKDLKTICSKNDCNRLLLTGTPLQNNLAELWSLLNFLLPDIFDDLETFQAWFDFDGEDELLKDSVDKTEIVSKLHKVLRPFLMRRLKKDVAVSLPDKHEYHLFASMSDWQREQYDALVSNTMKDSAGAQVRLSNLVMQLRKSCNHPYHFEWPCDPTGRLIVDEVLIQASGKLKLMDKLMMHLKAEGNHHTLIFSQMTSTLDILAEYLDMRKLTHVRIDGASTIEERVAAIDTFEKGGVDVFLLSTRAGGQGLNLVRADTVVLFDSDWNPQMDLQAQDRAHRIGQTRTVMVYRLATADSVEENMLDKANHKLRLEEIVVGNGNGISSGRASSLLALLKAGPLQSRMQPTTDSELAAAMDRNPRVARLSMSGLKYVDKS